MPRRIRHIRRSIARNARELGLQAIVLVVFLALMIGVLVPLAMQNLIEGASQEFVPSAAPST